jgi:hypothetical protein
MKIFDWRITMLNVVRRSQIIGSKAIDSSTVSCFGYIEEVWLDNSERIAYFSGGSEYLPIEQIAGVAMDVVSVYHRLVANNPENLRKVREKVCHKDSAIVLKLANY